MCIRDSSYLANPHVAMRLTDEMLVSILDVMRTPGGKRLSANQWQAMLDTESSVEQPEDISGWYHVCYCWSIITMASFMVARQSAREARQTLFYIQAIDQPVSVLQHAHRSDFFEELLRIPSIQTTKRLPGVCLLYTSPSPRDGLLSRMPSSA